MATKTTKAVEEILKDTGLPGKTGTVQFSNGKYVLALGRTTKEIPQAFVGSADLAKLVNTEVTALVAGSNIVAIIPKRPGRPPWGCYIPAPDIWKKINPEFQATLVDKFVALGTLTKLQGQNIKKEILQVG